MLQAAFSGAASQFELPGGSGPIAVLAQVAVGVVLTVFMQSSSAAMAVALTAASGGVLTLTSAAAVVIGANIGTTVTAVIASIGATPNAKRVALAHVAFNVLTACVALLMLPWLVDALSELARMIGINDDSATVLALFHTCFNVLGVLLIWPVADTLAQWLSRQFIQEENDATRPKFLDDTIKQVPTLAIDAMRQEIARAGDLASETIVAALQRTTEAELRRRLATVDAITKSIDEFAESMNRREMTRTSAEDLARLLRAERYIESIT
jgi:phosphate:Na+ symporter